MSSNHLGNIDSSSNDSACGNPQSVKQYPYLKLSFCLEDYNLQINTICKCETCAPCPTGPCRYIVNAQACHGFLYNYFGAKYILCSYMDPLGCSYRAFLSSSRTICGT